MKKLLSLILVIMMLLTIPVVSYAEEKSNVISISTPDMIILGRDGITPYYSQIYEFDVNVYDWMQYSKVEIIVQYNSSVIFPIYRQFPPTENYKNPVAHEIFNDDGTRIFCVSAAESPEYHNEKDVSFEILLVSERTGLHNIRFDVEAYDLDGNKVDVDLQIDNEIYPEVITAEEAGVYVLDALEIKGSRVYENCGTIVRDIEKKLNSDNFRIRNKNGKILTSDDVIVNGDIIEVLYEDMVAYSTSICISYDVDCDGKVTASDARLALRYSAQLINLADIAYHSADVDGKAGVNAADARLILRKAAQLD